MRYRRLGPPRGGPSNWAPSWPRPTMPWRACEGGIGTGRAPTGSSAGRWSSTRATCKHGARVERSEEHTSELQSRLHLVCRLLLEKKKILDNHSTHRYDTEMDAKHIMTTSNLMP